MRSLFCAWVVLAAALAGPALAEEAAGVHFFGFEEDRDFNEQPDFWRRIISAEYPAYLKASLTEKVAHDGKRSLLFSQNGGNLLYRSPQIEVSALHDYELEAWIKTEGLDRSKVRVRVIWLNALKREMGEASTEAIGGTTDWTRARVLVNLVPRGTSLAVIECLMEGRDIRGSAWFDSIRLVEHPKLEIGFGTEGNLIPAGIPRVFLGKITGLPGRSTVIGLELRDHLGRPAWEKRESVRSMTDSYEFVWRLPSELYGYYEGKCSVAPLGGAVLEVELPMVFPPPIPFSLGDREPALGIDLRDPGAWAGGRLAMLESLGTAVRVVLDDSDEEKARGAQDLLRRLASEGYFSVAVIPMRMIAEGGEDAIKWALVEYGDLVKAWQVGVTGESAEGSADVEKALALLRELTRPAPVGMVEEIAEGFASFQPDFVVVSASAGGGAGPEVDEAVSRWKKVWVELPAETAADMSGLVKTTLGQLKEGVERVVLSPRGEVPALFDEKLSPTASYLVWRNLNSLLSGGSYAGTLRLPDGSANLVFRKGKEFVLTCWREEGRQLEVANLGEEVIFWDIFGRRLYFPQAEGEWLMRVAEVPVLATGLNRTITEMRLSARLLADMLYMEAGVHEQGLSVTNRLGENLECRLDLRYPAGFRPERRQYVFDLGPDEEYVAEAPVSLPRDIEPGKQMIRATLSVSGRGALSLEILKEFDVVSEIEMNTSARRDGEFVEITQELINRAGSAVGLVALAGVPGELPQESLPATVEPGGVIVRSYRFAAEKVNGKRVWLAAREVNGPRFLNRYIEIDDEND